jgi:hypothetical protein
MRRFNLRALLTQRNPVKGLTKQYPLRRAKHGKYLFYAAVATEENSVTQE